MQRLLAFLLVFCQAYGPLRATAQTGVTQYVSLLLTPQGQLTEGMPMNLTCRFSQWLPSFVVLSMVSYNGLASQLSASTASLNGTEKLGSRIIAIRLDNYSIVFAFNYTLVVDGGVYACGASTSLSNAVAVTISSSAGSTTMSSSNQHFTGPVDTVTFAISVTVSLVCCFTALIVALVLRFRYGYRFRGSIYIRRSSSSSSSSSSRRTNATNSAPPNNDPEQLPTYESATNMGFDKSYLPPSYYEATSSHTHSQAQAQAEGAQVNVHVEPTVSATPNVAFTADSSFGSHTNPTYSPDNF